jgi:hypothetical protein
MTADHDISRIIEESALEPPVIEQETARLDQIDGHPKARREPQPGPSVLRNIRFEQGETHTASVVNMNRRDALHLCALRDAPKGRSSA